VGELQRPEHRDRDQEHDAQPLGPWGPAEEQPPEDDRNGAEHAGADGKRTKRDRGERRVVWRNRGHDVSRQHGQDRDEHARPKTQRSDEQ
jgi:hypothetical protein